MATEDFHQRIEMFLNSKEKLEIVEDFLKILNIEYKFIPSESYTSKLTRLIYEMPLDQVHELLVSSNKGYLEYINQFKKDLEKRKYWRSKFQKFLKF